MQLYKSTFFDVPLLSNNVEQSVTEMRTLEVLRRSFLKKEIGFTPNRKLFDCSDSESLTELDELLLSG